MQITENNWQYYITVVDRPENYVLLANEALVALKTFSEIAKRFDDKKTEELVNNFLKDLSQ